MEIGPLELKSLKRQVPGAHQNDSLLNVRVKKLVVSLGIRRKLHEVVLHPLALLRPVSLLKIDDCGFSLVETDEIRRSCVLFGIVEVNLYFLIILLLELHTIRVGLKRIFVKVLFRNIN